MTPAPKKKAAAKPASRAPRKARRRRIIIIANDRSGAATGNEAATAVCESLAALGCDAELWTAKHPGELPRLLRKARDAKPDVVTICGGDGSVNAAASALANSGVALGIVPQGTFNYVARRYGLPETPEAIARLLATGKTLDIGAGCVNDHWFLNNCSLGLYTDVIDARERHTARWGRMRLVAVLSALNTTLQPPARLPLRVLDARGAPLFAGRASLVFVGINPMQFDRAGLPGLSAEVARGALGAVLLRAVSPWRVVPMLFGAASSKLALLDEIEPKAMPSLTVELRQRKARVVIDGETLELTSPLKFSYQRKVLRLIVPSS